MPAAFGLLAGAFLVGTILQHLLGRAGMLADGRLRVVSMAAGVAMFVLALAAGLRPRPRRFLSSNRFAVPVLVMLTVLSVLGTLILQDQPAAVLARAYGPATLTVLGAFFLTELFHGLGFSAVCGLGAGGLALVLIRRRRWTLRYAGAVGAHLGLLLILLGAVVGNVWGIKGRVGLRTGGRADSFTATLAPGRTAEIPLGFTLQLDDFRVEHYDAAYRLMVFDISGGGQKRLLSVDPAGAPSGAAGLDRFGLELDGYWPDHRVETVVRPLDEQAGALRDHPAGLELAGGGWVLDEGGPGGGRATIDGVPVAFFLDTKRATAYLESLKDPRPATPHRLVVGDARLPAEVGRSVALPGGDRKVKILRFFQDFVIDTQTRTPTNRSARPVNPAVEIAVLGPGGEELGRTWLFARFPEFHGRDPQAATAGIGYAYVGEERPPPAWVVVGEEGAAWRIEDGRIAARLPVEPGTGLRAGDINIGIRGLHPAVEVAQRHTSGSSEPRNPVARLQVAGREQPVLLDAGKPLRLSEERVAVLAPKGGDTVRDYLSTVSVFEEGRKVLTREVEVNLPLHYGGYAVYQADYRPDDPGFSGFEIVSDPGMPVVYLGLLVNAAGVLCVMFLSPLLRRRRSARGTTEAPA